MYNDTRNVCEGQSSKIKKTLILIKKRLKDTISQLSNIVLLY